MPLTLLVLKSPSRGRPVLLAAPPRGSTVRQGPGAAAVGGQVCPLKHQAQQHLPQVSARTLLTTSSKPLAVVGCLPSSLTQQPNMGERARALRETYTGSGGPQKAPWAPALKPPMTQQVPRWPAGGRESSSQGPCTPESQGSMAIPQTTYPGKGPVAAPWTTHPEKQGLWPLCGA